MRGERVLKVAGWVLVGLAGAAVMGLVLGLLVQALWNWLMPSLFGLPKVTYWQAVGLFVLCHLLFSGHGDHDSHASHTHHHAVSIRERVRNAVHGQGAQTDAQCPEAVEPSAPAASPACAAPESA